MPVSRKRKSKKTKKTKNNPEGLSRTPGIKVIRALREEVGYSCPVPGCDNPYLEWHHYNPPWKKKAHHNPDGMIALCTYHHKKADGGAWTVDQLDDMKAKCSNRPEEIRGRFDWLREEVLALAGGYFITNRGILRINIPIIWFEPDDNGMLRLNIQFFDDTGKLKLFMRNNDWIVKRDIKDLDCPPSGKRLHAFFRNGDYLKLDFKVATDNESLIKYSEADQIMFQQILNRISLPITILRVDMLIQSFGIKMKGPKMEDGATSHSNLLFDGRQDNPFNNIGCGFSYEYKDWISTQEFMKMNASVLKYGFPEWFPE